MPPFDSADAWTKQQFHGDDYNINSATGGDVDVEYDSGSGTWYAVLIKGINDGIAMASASDPTSVVWTDEGVLVDTNDIAEDYITDPALIEANGTWYLYFSAGGSSDKTTQDIKYSTASSPTGFSSFSSTGITADSGWKSNGVGEPDVAYDSVNGRWILAVTGYDGSTQDIGIATSSDGQTFSEIGANPVISGAEDQCILARDGKYSMYYNEEVSSPGVVKAISVDLAAWDKTADSPILSPSASEDTDGMYAPQVVNKDGTWRMWYTAFADSTVPAQYYRGYAEGDVDQLAGRIKHYDGSSFNTKPLWEYTGSVWQRAQQLKHYDGSSFNVTPPTSASATAPSDNIPEYPKRCDGFEDNDIVEYAGDTGAFGPVSSPVQEGNYALAGQGPGGGNANSIASTGGLDYHPAAGNTFRFWNRTNADTDVAIQTGFAAQSEGTLPNGYYVGLNRGSSEMFLVRYDGSFDVINSVSQTFSDDTWYEVEVDWGSSGDFTVTLFDSGGAQLNQLTGSDSTYTSGGIWFRVDNSDTDVYWDYYRLTA
jgi:predicted GH43/DUF377 family glycosyl hydrolase